MEELIIDYKIPLGKWMAFIIDLLNEHAYFIFDFFTLFLDSIIIGTTSGLLFLPSLLLISLFTVFTWFIHRNIGLTLFSFLSLLLILNLGYWQETVETLVLVGYSTLICMLVGVPLGILAAHNPRFYAVLRPILDLMQTIPTFVYLIPTLILFGLGVVPGLISTVIFAIAAPVRLTCLGISSVPLNLREAGVSFGCGKTRLLYEIELPYALPTIMAGLTQCIMLSLSMVVIAALVGADGLGKPVVRALNTVNIVNGFEAGLCIVIIAILLDRVCKQPEKKSFFKGRNGIQH